MGGFLFDGRERCGYEIVARGAFEKDVWMRLRTGKKNREKKRQHGLAGQSSGQSVLSCLSLRSAV